MKKFLLGSVGLAAMIAGPAIAADMPVKAPPAPPVAYYDWSGAYIGFNAGGVWHKNSVHFPSPGAAGLGFAGVNPDFSTNSSDGIYGFHAGAQWQWGAWVLGVEAALSGCMQECRSSSGPLSTAAGFAPNTAFETKMTNLFTVGPRLGYAFDRWMIFATGGWASANLKGAPCSTITNTCAAPGAGFNGASRNDGWYAGGGIDYMVHKGPLVDVILGAEYQHYDVSGRRAFCISPGCSPATGGDYDLSAKGDIVRARLTIKTQGYGFLWGGPGASY
jgi:outer membrane immunogenic protein